MYTGKYVFAGQITCSYFLQTLHTHRKVESQNPFRGETHTHKHTCRELMKMYVVKRGGGAQGSNVNVCWTGGGQTVVLIDLGPSLFIYLDPNEAVSMQQLPDKKAV